MSHYYVDTDLCKAWGIDSDLDWFVINYIYKPINDNED